MDQSLEKLLKENLELSQENNKILKSMRSSARWSRFFKIIFWFIVVGSTAGTYYYFQPLLSEMIKTYQGLISGADKIGGIGGTVSSLPQGFDINSILKNLPKQ